MRQYLTLVEDAKETETSEEIDQLYACLDDDSSSLSSSDKTKSKKKKDKKEPKEDKEKRNKVRPFLRGGVVFIIKMFCLMGHEITYLSGFEEESKIEEKQEGGEGEKGRDRRRSKGPRGEGECKSAAETSQEGALVVWTLAQLVS